MRLLRRGPGLRTRCWGQRSLGLPTIHSRNFISRGARANSRHKVDELRRSCNSCEVHLEAAIGLVQSELVAETELERVILLVKSQGASGGGRGIESQPESQSKRPSTVDPVLAAPAATRLGESRTKASPCPPKKYGVRRITGYEQERRVIQRQIRVGPRPSCLLPCSCSTRRVT